MKPVCPKCGSDYGYYQLTKVSGHAKFTFNWDGTTGDSTDCHDSVKYKETQDPGLCISCRKSKICSAHKNSKILAIKCGKYGERKNG